MENFNKKIILALSFLLFLPSILCAMSTADELTQVFHPIVKETRGPVVVKGMKYSLWEEARVGMLLLSGDILRTEEEGFARIEFPSGTIELYENTVIVIPSIEFEERKKDIRDVVVESGNTLFDINPTGVERKFQFQTRNVQGGVKGTLFTVSYLREGTAVNVYRGIVHVYDLEGSPYSQVELFAGEAVRVEMISDFKLVRGFDPEYALENYKYNIPPGLNDKGLPADYNANSKNKGKRNRGVGTNGVSGVGTNGVSVNQNDLDDDDQGEDEK